MIKSNKMYDALKYIAQILIPAVGTLYFSLSDIWNLPDAGKVVGTLTVIDTFLGVLLHLSNTAYEKSGAKFDGSIDIDHQDEKKSFSLNLDSHPDELEHKDEITFKVNKKEPLQVKKKPAKRVAKKTPAPDES